MGVYSSFLDILGAFHLGSTITFACIFGIWARKTHTLLLHSKFSLLLTQRNCAENNRHKTSRVTAFFCTKNHRNPFTSLRERVEWRCHASSKKVPKLKTHVLVMYECMYVWMCYIRSYMTKTRVFSFGTFWELALHLHPTRSRRLVNGFRYFLVQNEAESLLVLFPLFPAHFCWAENNKHF